MSPSALPDDTGSQDGKSSLVDSHSTSIDHTLTGNDGVRDNTTESELDVTTVNHHQYHNESWRIALYYLYFELTPNQLKDHIQYQIDVCHTLSLMGRIRISHEGINGVLSGTLSNLYLYEERITNALGEVRAMEGGCIGSETERDSNCDCNNIAINLDVKYCHLRTDLPVEQQLFDSLVVKETKTVISLFDKPPPNRKRDRRRKSSNKHNSNINRNERGEEDGEQNLQQQQRQQSDGVQAIDNDTSVRTNLDMRSLQRTIMDEPLRPATHLTAEEWNAKLDSVTTPHSALLVDVRNVYESRVGHFAHPTTPTLLTNTRKYSDLPQLLADNDYLHDPRTKQVFMYCTGGVRCERVSMLMQELYPDKEIYQLQGGIQKYLERYSQQNQMVASRHDDIGTTVESDPTGLTSSSDQPSHIQYFKGKNFVFDPRRTDPVHFGETVGQCLVCGTPHDDYDNGHAPGEEKAARCNTCRMLILICNDCRPKYISHGEHQQEEQVYQDETQDGEKRPQADKRTLLYCKLDHCIHEGAAPEPELLSNGLCL